MKKKLLAILLAGCMPLSLLWGCSGGSSENESATKAAGESGGSAATEAADQNVTEGNGGGADTAAFGPVYDEYSEMSMDELYAKAKEEGGEINVYATSSKMLKNEEDFEEAFPGLDLVVSDLDNDEVFEKVKLENDTGNITGDVMQVKDAAGDIFYGLYEEGIVDMYYPKDICANVEEELLKYGYPLYTSQSFWYYNTDAFPDGQPIKSWWDILDTKEDGSQKYRILTKEIGQETAYLALFASFILNADDMAAAYKEKTGQDLEYTYDASAFDFEVPANNAGVEFMYRFSQLEMTFIGDGDELVLAVNNSTADDPALALASAGKIGNRDESGYKIGWCTDLTPYTGLENAEYMYTVAGCDNPAGARLFIKWCTGGEDGKSGGLKPFMKEGNWPARQDVACDWNPVATVAECGAVAPDIEGIYEIFYDAQDMWTYWLSQNPHM